MTGSRRPGIMRTSVPDHAALDPLALLEAAASAGYGGVLVASLLDVSPTLDAAALSAWRARAEALGLRLGAGLGWFNPLRSARSAPIVALGDGDLVAGAARLVETMAGLGLDRAYLTIGMIEDRFADDPAWERQLDAVARGLDALAPLLRRLGFRLLLKTHEEITTQEIARLVERVGADVVGVALDPVNLLVRLEDPLAGARRLAPFVAQVHLDDADVRFDEDRLRRHLRRMGEGVIPWEAILALVPEADLWVEMHRGQFAMEAFDPDWLARQPDLALGEYATVVGTAMRLRDTPVPDDGPDARLDSFKAWLARLGGS